MDSPIEVGAAPAGEELDAPMGRNEGASSPTSMDPGDSSIGETTAVGEQTKVDKDGDSNMDVEYCMLGSWTACPEEDMFVLKMGGGQYHKPDISEVYSPPRVTKKTRGRWA